MEIAISLFKVRLKVIQLKKSTDTISTKTQNFKASIDVKKPKTKTYTSFHKETEV